MVWVVIAVSSAILAALAVAGVSRGIHGRREPGREGRQDREASLAYDRVSRSPVFMLERHIMLTRLARRKPSGTVVDIGCGPGYLAVMLSRHYPMADVIGLDNNEEMINIARQNWPSGKYGVKFDRGDAHRLPFADNTVDLVVSSLSMHHWADPGRVFREIQRVLKPGGEFLVFDLRRDGPRLFYLMLKLGQALAPTAIRRTNGAVGSFWASYTPSELKTIFSEVGIDGVHIDVQLGWMFAWGGKLEVKQSSRQR